LVLIFKMNAMNYDIRIKGDSFDNGTIELDKMANIAKATKEIAQKALMLKIFGYSDLKVPADLEKALEIRLEKISGSVEEGTHLLLAAGDIKSNVNGIDLDALKPGLVKELSTLTPMALVILSFNAALGDKEEDKNNLDRPLLKTLLTFKKSFTSDTEVFYFSNRQSVPQIEIRKADFKKIEKLDESIPEPQKVVISGKVDELKHSKARLVLVTSNGNVNVVIKDEKLMGEITSFFGKECTIQGIANYRLGGMLSFVEMQGFGQPKHSDQYFSKKPQAMNALQQILFQTKQGKKKNPFNDIAGLWPGNETDEEFDELLKTLD
jgi:hypothetical protein